MRSTLRAVPLQNLSNTEGLKLSTDEFFGGRRKALEESFFAKRDRQLLENLRGELDSNEKKSALTCACGVTDESVLELFVSLEIGVETLAALCLVPLVEVAWADGDMDDKERSAILSAAADAGLSSSDPSYQMLQQWLDEPPEAELLTAWKQYVGALCQKLEPAAQLSLKEDLMRRARGVAEAAGGILGLGNKVSKSEQAKLDELEQAFRW